MNRYLIIISIVGWGLWGFTTKIASQRLHPFQMQTIGVLVSAILLPVYLYEARSATTQFSFTTIYPSVIGSICAITAGLAFIFGVRNGNVGSIAILSSSYPLLTLALSAIFLKEEISFPKILGSLLVIIGIVLVGSS